MHTWPKDPAFSREATAKRTRDASRSTSFAIRAWDRERGRDDPTGIGAPLLERCSRLHQAGALKNVGV
jgi:hypothetical protein